MLTNATLGCINQLVGQHTPPVVGDCPIESSIELGTDSTEYLSVVLDIIYSGGALLTVSGSMPCLLWIERTLQNIFTKLPQTSIIPGELFYSCMVVYVQASNQPATAR